MKCLLVLFALVLLPQARAEDLDQDHSSFSAHCAFLKGGRLDFVHFSNNDPWRVHYKAPFKLSFSGCTTGDYNLSESEFRQLYESLHPEIAKMRAERADEGKAAFQKAKLEKGKTINLELKWTWMTTKRGSSCGLGGTPELYIHSVEKDGFYVEQRGPDKGTPCHTGEVFFMTREQVEKYFRAPPRKAVENEEAEAVIAAPAPAPQPEEPAAVEKQDSSASSTLD